MKHIPVSRYKYIPKKQRKYDTKKKQVCPPRISHSSLASSTAMTAPLRFGLLMLGAARIRGPAGPFFVAPET